MITGGFAIKFVIERPSQLFRPCRVAIEYKYRVVISWTVFFFPPFYQIKRVYEAEKLNLQRKCAVIVTLAKSDLTGRCVRVVDIYTYVVLIQYSSLV